MKKLENIHHSKKKKSINRNSLRNYRLDEISKQGCQDSFYKCVPYVQVEENMSMMRREMEDTTK